MLLEIEGEHVRVFTGLGMRMRWLQLLGPVRALRVAQAVARHGGPVLIGRPIISGRFKSY
jgi:hypothetical protein